MSLDPSRLVGMIKWFDGTKGFGFAINMLGDEIRDVFVHISQFRIGVTPQPGQVIEFYALATAKGIKAEDCVVLKGIDIWSTDTIKTLNKAYNQVTV